MKREVEMDGMQISTTKLQRDVMQVSGALLVGEQNAVHVVERLRSGDPDLQEIFKQLREEDLEVQHIGAAQRLGETSEETLAALIGLQEDKPLLLRSLAFLAGRANWQELLESA